MRREIRRGILVLAMVTANLFCTIYVTKNLAAARAPINILTASVDQLFAKAQPVPHQQSTEQAVAIYCHVIEGAWCYLVDDERLDEYDGHYDPKFERDTYSFDPAIARQLTADIGVKYIDYSKNNAVKVRCWRRHHYVHRQHCAINRGGGWTDLPIVAWR